MYLSAVEDDMRIDVGYLLLLPLFVSIGFLCGYIALKHVESRVLIAFFILGGCLVLFFASRPSWRDVRRANENTFLLTSPREMEFDHHYHVILDTKDGIIRCKIGTAYEKSFEPTQLWVKLTGIGFDVNPRRPQSAESGHLAWKVHVHRQGDFEGSPRTRFLEFELATSVEGNVTPAPNCIAPWPVEISSGTPEHFIDLRELLETFQRMSVSYVDFLGNCIYFLIFGFTASIPFVIIFRSKSRVPNSLKRWRP